jgi:pantoate--beta-alanine ligase
LSDSREKIGAMPLDELKQWVINRIDSTPAFTTEYFEIIDRDTLQPVPQYKENALQGCIAVHAGSVRLIDNVAFF